MSGLEPPVYFKPTTRCFHYSKICAGRDAQQAPEGEVEGVKEPCTLCVKGDVIPPHIKSKMSENDND